MRKLLACWILVSAACGGCGGSKGANDTDGGNHGGADARPGGSSDARLGPDAAPRPDGNPMVPKQHPRIYLTSENAIGAANATRLQNALSSGSGPATRFKDMVDGEMGGADYYNFYAWFAALLGQLTGTASYCTYAVGLVDANVTSEEALINAGNTPDVAGDDYLDVGNAIGDLALTYDWCYSTVSSSQKTRWLAYASQAVYNVWNPNDAVWGGVAHPWSGWAIDDPADNYYYSFLRATLLFGLAADGEDPSAAGWIDYFRKTKIQDELMPLFQQDLVGGGSREGTGYGVSMAGLFVLYDIWYGSTSERIDDLTDHALSSLKNYLHLIVPTDDFVAITGDHARESTGALFDYDRNYMQILTSLYSTDPIAPYGKWMLENCSVPEMGQYFDYVYDFLYDDPSVTAASNLDALGTSYYASGIGQIYTRSDWSTGATWLNFMAGPYTESHAHQDQGNLLVYKGSYRAYDANFDSHSGIHQEPEFHNLVRFVNGGSTVGQVVGADPSQLLALHDEAAYTYMSADTTPIYDNSTRVTKSQREVVFLKPDVIVTFDRDDGSADTKVWQLNAPVQPTLSGNDITVGGTHPMHVFSVLPAGATSQVVDWTTVDSNFLQQDTMNSGWRVDTSSSDAMARFLAVWSIDGAASSVTAVTNGSQLGADIKMSDGTHVIVTFEDTATGGAITWKDSGGTTTSSATLGDGVDTLPLFAP